MPVVRPLHDCPAFAVDSAWFWLEGQGWPGQCALMVDVSAHEIPPEFQDDRGEWDEQVVQPPLLH